jgi:hypothetical protein
MCRQVVSGDDVCRNSAVTIFLEFQQSAGALTHLKEHVLSWVPQEPTMDMSPDTLQALSTLMIAQAQDAIYLKAAKGSVFVTIFTQILFDYLFCRQNETRPTRQSVRTNS